MYYKKAERKFKDELMAIVDKMPLPKDFNKWLSNYPFKDTFYMFYEIEGKGKNKQYWGYCQHCKNERIVLGKVTAGKLGKCPCCHKTIRYRNKKFSKNNEHFKYVSIIQQLPVSGKQFIQRNFHIRKLDDFLNYEFNIYEMERCYITYDVQSGFRIKQWYRLYNFDWTFGCYNNMGFEIPGCLWIYNKNLNALCFDEYKYSRVKEYAKATQLSVVEYLQAFKEYPSLEYLVELKMFKFVDEIIYFNCFSSKLNLKANKLQDILCLKGVYFKYALNLKKILNFEMLEILQFSQSYNLPLFEYPFEFIKRLKYNLDLTENLKCFLKLGCKLIYDYCWKQAINMRDYFDYIRNCQILNYDLYNTAISKPYDFKIAHDQAYLKVESKKNKQLDSAVKKILNTYQCLTFEKDDYCVVVPKKADDIRKEGIDNKNCVGGYVCRVKEGSSIICFVRHCNEKDKSFYTLELNPKTLKVVQCRGYHNEPTAEEEKVKKFVNYWQKNIVLKKLKVS